MSFKPRFLTTAIGSMPFKDPGYAVKLVLETLPEAPIWPQLPGLGLNEQMEIQYSEHLPSVFIDRVKKRMYFDTARDFSEEFAAFFENYMAAMDPDEGTGDCSAMAISRDFASGLYSLEETLKAQGRHYPFVKVQTTGACSFSLTIVDENKRAIYYNEDFRDLIVKALAMKCRWQIQKFQAYADRVICFIDEPILSAFGSSTYVTVKREDVVAILAEMIDAVHRDNGLAGIHCCGNTEWSILIDAGVDIVNFDAYSFGDTIAMYSNAVKTFLEKGGALAWGIVPTSAAVLQENAESLADKLEAAMNHLAAGGIDKQLIAEQALITPSCGTGSMEAVPAEKVFRLTNELCGLMKGRYGF